MSECHVTISPEAIEELANIHSYIAGELGSPGAAQCQLERLLTAARSLAELPDRHELVDNQRLASLGIRRMSVGRYILLYRHEPGAREVTVLHFVYGGRDVRRLLHSMA